MPGFSSIFYFLFEGLWGLGPRTLNWVHCANVMLPELPDNNHVEGALPLSQGVGVVRTTIALNS